MKSRTLTCITAMTLFAALAIPVPLSAQHTRFKLIDLGTPGGPNSYPTIAGPGIRFLNDAGTVAGWGDTTAPDPTCFGNDGLCLLTHTFRWKNGARTDLGALPGTNSSAAVAINAAGSILGVSQNGLTDPISGFPEVRAVLWKHDLLTELGALGNVVLPQNLNNVGQAVGGFENTTPDPFSLFGFPTQTRAFLSQKGVMQDIGTLGGPDALAFSINERGQVAGQSYTNAEPNKTTGLPTLEPFLFQDGKMISLGSLGGTMGGTGPQGSIMINNRGQIIGTSNLAGDQFFHAFLWENGVMSDLRTLGGPTSTALWINEVGEIVGEADISDVPDGNGFPHHAFLWRDGNMRDLGTLAFTSHAESINNKGQVVGRSRIECEICVLQHGFLWENGGPMIDLNTLIPAGSNFQLIDAYDINDRGEILVQALPVGEQPMEGVQLGHLALLVPCSGDETSCSDSSDPSAVAVANSIILTGTANRSGVIQRSAAEWRAQLAKRYHMPGAAIQQH
jgi:probable HAF family extracellular repeat protein